MTFDSSSLPNTASSSDARLSPSLICRLVERTVPQLSAGRLQILLPTGEVIERCGDRGGPEAMLAVHRWRALWRMLHHGEHGFADGFLAGDWSTTDLAKLLEYCLYNEVELAPRSRESWFTLARNRLMHRRQENTLRGSRRNVAAHYDLGNAFYGLWLDRGMNYSSALYAADETLEAAQDAKLDRIAELLDLSGGDHVLEIGCGWGALAERLVRRHGCTVTGITLSSAQLEYAKDRLARQIENGSVDLRLLDYRDVQGSFDGIASIEMFEAVGERYWPSYFAKLRSALAAGGNAVLQIITIDESRFAAYRNRPDFIQRFIFPGGMLPTAAIIEREAAAVGLKLVQRVSLGASYVRTLREWRNRFLRAWPKIEPLGFDQRFRRMWTYYLSYCEVGFDHGAIDVTVFKLAG
jgi:cyclopropane-fatty-acyl-phospholipid synthase